MSYIVEQWIEGTERSRDGFPSDPWKIGKTPVHIEYPDCDAGRMIYCIISQCGIISNVKKK